MGDTLSRMRPRPALAHALGVAVVIVSLTMPRAFGATAVALSNGARPTSHANAAPALPNDFNADGYADLAIGAPFDDVGTIQAAGKVNVIYGSPDGLSATFVPDQMWDQNSSGIDGKSEAYDLFGYTVASGDFNNDGFWDLAVHSKETIEPNKRDAGAVNVIYGSADGLSA